MAGDAHLRRGQQRSQHCPWESGPAASLFSDWMSVLGSTYRLFTEYITSSGLVMVIINEEDDHSSRWPPEDY